MTLKDIASVSGKGGLFRILGTSRSGFILESLDDQKARSVTPVSAKVSVLEEISIYTTTAEGTVSLLHVLKEVRKTFSDQLPVHPESTPDQLREFLTGILPEHDQQRVYTSDIKKLVRWYGILAARAPEIFDAPSSTDQENQD